MTEAERKETSTIRYGEHGKHCTIRDGNQERLIRRKVTGTES